MQMEKNEDGGSKESTRMTRRQGAERQSARAFVSSCDGKNYSTTGMRANDGDTQRAPRLVTHCRAHYERWDVRRDVCARLQFLLLLALHQLGWSADNGGCRPRLASLAPFSAKHMVGVMSCQQRGLWVSPSAFCNRWRHSTLEAENDPFVNLFRHYDKDAVCKRHSRTFCIIKIVLSNIPLERLTGLLSHWVTPE